MYGGSPGGSDSQAVSDLELTVLRLTQGLRWLFSRIPDEAEHLVDAEVEAGMQNNMDD